MKKKFFVIALMCTMTINVDAQVYSGDTWMQLPTACAKGLVPDT